MVRAIEGDLRRDWTVSDMAAVLGVSASQLRRLVFQALGASPRQVLCNVRLETAARLLVDPAVRIKEIQARVGIADASTFCRDFRDRFGVSPSEYRYRLQASRTNSIDNHARSGQETTD
jgi:transcriptional regulator GlxA family with amidase domain